MPYITINDAVIATDDHRTFAHVTSAVRDLLRDGNVFFFESAVEGKFVQHLVAPSAALHFNFGSGEVDDAENVEWTFVMTHYAKLTGVFRIIAEEDVERLLETIRKAGPAS